MLFGIGMMLAPGAGALALIWVIGTYAVIMGVAFVALALRLKNTPVPDVSAWESAKETVKNIACGNVG